MVNTKEEVKFNQRGLLPSILQDDSTGEVLMLGYMNQEALERTKESGKAWFWSRSRQKLWLKGESSGNYQLVKDIYLDCDRDTLLLKVRPDGPTCHTGEKSCFFNSLSGEFQSEDDNDLKDQISTQKSEQGVKQEANIDISFLTELYNIILSRKINPSPKSYTRSLIDKGIDRISRKIGEEASEVIIAGMNNDQEEIIYESADLIYHLFVLLVAKGIELEEINNELKERHFE
jgi:phosphoribosyl-ATP pyrophosphohydrolase/phosphoribosyl-AMP cyclohydrolase